MRRAQRNAVWLTLAVATLLGLWHLRCREPQPPPPVDAPNAEQCAAGATLVTGMLVDEHGKPVEGILLCAADGRQHLGYRRTRKDGSFCLAANTADPPPFRLTSLANGVWEPRPDARGFTLVRCHGDPVWEPLDDPREFRWGMRDIRLVVRRRPMLELRVVEFESWRPVEEFTVSCRSESGVGDLEVGGRFPGGRATIPWCRGRNEASVQPADPALWGDDPQQFELNDGTASPLIVRVRRMVPLMVTVVDRAGVPVTGTRVELSQLTPGADLRWLARASAFGVEASFGPVTECVVPRPRPRSRHVAPRRLSKGETDASGRVTLHGFPNLSDLVLRVLGPGHVGSMDDQVSLPAGGTHVTMTVSRGASLAGTLAPQELVLFGPEVRLRLVSAGVGSEFLQVLNLVTPSAPVPVGKDGAFHLDTIPPGTWDVHLSLTRCSGTTSSRPLATVTVAGEYPLHIELDASALRPAALRGSVLLDGQPATGGQVQLMTSAHVPAAEFPLDWAGRFHARALMPGKYGLSLQPAGEHARAIRARDELEIRPGTAVEHTFALRRPPR